MTNAELRAQCAELVDALENARRIIRGGDGTLHIDTAEPVLRRAYALLAQLAPEPPVDGDMVELVDNCIVAYAEDPDIISSGRYMMIDDGKARATLLQQLSTPTPPPTDDDLIEIARELRKTAEYLQLGCGWDSALKAIQRAADLIEGDLLQRLKPKAKQPTSEEFLKVFNENDWNYISPETFEDIARTVLQEWG